MNPPRPHDPGERVVIACAGAWELRQFADDDPKLAYFGPRGFLHVQLWNPARSASILTPSRLTAGQFEIRTRDGFTAAPTWSAVVAALPEHDLPGRAWLRAIDRWLIAPHEPGQVRLMRSWW
ncbi:MAG: hypothetical protein ACREI7_14065, partial [Myxococcota bacterium]